MSELIVPPTLTALLMAFITCFQARSWLTFQWLVLGWVQCQGRRTLTEVALASGVIGERHISVFHRFFSRASLFDHPQRSGESSRLARATVR